MGIYIYTYLEGVLKTNFTSSVQLMQNNKLTLNTFGF